MSDAATIQFAARWRRLLASAIDAILVPMLTIVLVMLTDVAEDAEDFADNAWMLHVLGLAVLSYLILNGFGLWRHGQTIGKRMLGIMIVHSSSSMGQPLATLSDEPNFEYAPLWKLICVRALFFPCLYLVVIPWLAIVPILDQLLIFRRDRRCLHDLVSGTVVVNR